MRKTLLKLHLFIGCLFAPVLFVAGASGALVVFEGPYADAVANVSLTRVDAGATPLSLDALRDSVRAAMQGTMPDAEVRAVSFPLEWRNTYVFTMGSASAKGMHSLYVDPWRGRVIGDDAQARSPLRWAHNLHTRLMYDAAGKTVVAWGAVALVFLALTGLYLWWPGKILRVRRDASTRRRIFELHNMLGGLSWVFMLLFGLTGVVVHWEEGSASVLRSMTGASLPPAQPKPTTVCAGKPMVSLDSISANINRAAPGAYATSIQFGEKDADYAMARMRFPEDKTPAGRTLVLAERCSAHVVWTLATRTAPLPYRYTRMWNRSIHTGDLWGWPTRILAVIAALLLPVMALTGPIIWWSRRRGRTV